MDNALAQRFRAHLAQTISLSDEEFAAIITKFQQQSYAKYVQVFREGDRVNAVYFVLNGLLKLVYHDDAGKQHILSFAMEDWWETDFHAFFKHQPSKLSLICLERCDLLQLSHENYQKLCLAFPSFERFLLQKSIAGNMAAQNRILSLLTSQAKERYEQLLASYPQLLQRLSKTQLAAYLGVSRETLSRLYR
ncbi:Crp/Fnr family transcriptional regulator [Sphingobacterium oryzagri]|uniref:Crp/Fnr family transcriptional regulator n=1 Tax=Sphingobacterium oryzagri TaxID=3025669 RepID=A0ABY7WLN7_9SPHI|nr:Crp/Fnr family transcriptional regulator [Sphingobacterium sp. KACC 22765]WDF70073.1 Crp/Fnr family transcriptional regulator [Sphingobacterium sp. KACC 22765]